MNKFFIPAPFFVFTFLFLTACATKYNIDDLSSEEQLYLQKAAQTHSQFIADASKSEQIWSRGIIFVNKFSGMRIQSSSQYHLSTYYPSGDYATIGYELTRELLGDNKVKFTITCNHAVLNAKFTDAVCRNNEKLLSYYMQNEVLYSKFVDTETIQ